MARIREKVVEFKNGRWWVVVDGTPYRLATNEEIAQVENAKRAAEMLDPRRQKPI